MKNKWLSLSIVPLICGCADGSKATSTPDVQVNENPKKSYVLDVKFIESPGPIEGVAVTAHYKVGTDCTPPMPLSGAVLPPEHDVSLLLRKVDGDVYEAVFHQDALRDDDYFGLGVCKWALQNVSVKFSSPSTLFTASLPNPESGFQSNPQQTEHFLRADYFKKPAVGDVVFGEKAGFYLPKMGPQFQVVLAANRLSLEK